MKDILCVLRNGYNIPGVNLQDTIRTDSCPDQCRGSRVFALPPVHKIEVWLSTSVSLATWPQLAERSLMNEC